ncbi:MAG: hypothetical protein IPO14_01590 [Saprospiraceae bacterium]|nr:hypothetical protein [Saprospiraceae bacterium]
MSNLLTKSKNTLQFGLLEGEWVLVYSSTENSSEVGLKSLHFHEKNSNKKASITLGRSHSNYSFEQNPNDFRFILLKKLFGLVRCKLEVKLFHKGKEWMVLIWKESLFCQSLSWRYSRKKLSTTKISLGKWPKDIADLILL